MMGLYRSNLCTGCAACANICPEQCVSMLADDEGFLYPTADSAKCVDCGICQSCCPVLHPVTHEGETTAFAAACTDESIRMKSTSGGVFSILCQWTFDHGGVVFGAAYADDFSVEHRSVQSMDDLPELRTAKYAQSRIGNSFQKVKQLLDDGQYVLFSGTPCQIGGLRAFLGEDCERLILVDIICHGIPSPAVWSQYIACRRKNDASGAELTSINLRSKETGWPGYSVCFEYENGIRYTARGAEEPFMKCFIGNLCLRRSCYDCRFKGISRISDFTLGDYWGVWNQLPEYNDGKGTSVVLIHSEKGRKIWDETAKQVQSKQVDTAQCLAENTSAIQSPEMPSSRNEFMKRFTKEDFNALVGELMPPPPPEPKYTLLRRALAKLRRIVK